MWAVAKYGVSEKTLKRKKIYSQQSPYVFNKVTFINGLNRSNFKVLYDILSEC